MTVRTMHQKEADLRAVLTDLAARWEQMARTTEHAIDHMPEPRVPVVTAEQAERVHVYRCAARDLSDALRTGRIPHDLMTDAELEQHGTSEETAR